MRLYVCGTDTDVGKTRVVRLLAAALARRGRTPAVVKLVQTGVDPGAPGDADDASAGGTARALEFARFAKPADPWTAARAAGVAPLRAGDLAERLRVVAGDVLAEGSGGAMVPLNADETITTVVERAGGLTALVVVGLRLGCMNHALLTLRYLVACGLPVAGFALNDRWDAGAGYAEEVAAVLGTYAPVIATIAHGAPETPAVIASAERLCAALLGQAG
jgi:dethiobiotin synthase